MGKENKQIILREVGISATKGAIGAIPFVGTALNEVIFEGRGRVKQERVNVFIKMLQKYMETVSENEIDFHHIKSEEFGDIFESILKRVIYTSSEEKMKRFRKILVSEMISPSETNFTETFLDIISRLEELQILMLNNIRIASENTGGLHENIFKKQNEIKIAKEQLKIEIENQEKGYANNLLSVRSKVEELQRNVQKYLSILADNQKYFDHRSYNISMSQNDFYLQDLKSKALLSERLIPRNGKEPPVTSILEITSYGIEFLKYIEDN